MSRRTICPGKQCPGGPFITSHSGVMSAEHQSPSHPTLAFAVAFLSFHSKQSERTCFPPQPHKPRGPAHGTESHNRVAHPFASFAKGWGIGRKPDRCLPHQHNSGCPIHRAALGAMGGTPQISKRTSRCRCFSFCHPRRGSAWLCALQLQLHLHLHLQLHLQSQLQSQLQLQLQLQLNLQL